MRRATRFWRKSLLNLVSPLLLQASRPKSGEKGDRYAKLGFFLTLRRRSSCLFLMFCSSFHVVSQAPFCPPTHCASFLSLIHKHTHEEGERDRGAASKLSDSLRAHPGTRSFLKRGIISHCPPPRLTEGEGGGGRDLTPYVAPHSHCHRRHRGKRRVRRSGWG